MYISNLHLYSKFQIPHSTWHVNPCYLQSANNSSLVILISVNGTIRFLAAKAKNLTDMFLSFPLIPSTSNASEDLGSNSKMHHHFLWFSPSPLLFHGISLDHLLYTNWNILLTLCYYCLPPIHSPRIGQSNHFKMQSTFIFSLLKSL